jgi:hypothetical protein
MNISDEMLSAFLDMELHEDDMEKVRSALESDDDLVMRLAELAQADQWVAENAAVIDNTPMPEDLLQLAKILDKKTAQNQATETSSKVVSLSRWQSLNNRISKHYALAAGIAMAFGVGTVTLMQSQQPSTLLTADIAQILEQVRSGEISSTAQGDTITANLSFTNHAGDYCRQFQTITEQTASVNIACKEKAQWRLKITEQISRPENMTDYRVASNKAHLDRAIDAMIKGNVMDSAQEQQAIQSNWQATKK